MAPRQLRGCRVHALVALLLPLLPPVTSGTTCPPPIPVEYADIQVKSYKENSRERYVCNSGFKRKAGTSSLTKCVLNKTTNIAHWTSPNLKCIRDPSLAHQRPALLSTVSPPLTARTTPHAQSPSPPGKEPAALSPKPDAAVATETSIVPDSWLTSSWSHVTGTDSHESSQAPTQTTASTSLETPGAHPHSSRKTTVVISTSVALFCGMCAVSFLTWYWKSRYTSHSGDMEMDTMEVMPMTAETSGREEAMRTCPHNL